MFNCDPIPGNVDLRVTDFHVISSSRNEEMSSGTNEMEAELDAGGKAGLQDFHYAL